MCSSEEGEHKKWKYILPSYIFSLSECTAKYIHFIFVSINHVFHNFFFFSVILLFVRWYCYVCYVHYLCLYQQFKKKSLMKCLNSCVCHSGGVFTCLVGEQQQYPVLSSRNCPPCPWRVALWPLQEVVPGRDGPVQTAVWRPGGTRTVEARLNDTETQKQGFSWCFSRSGGTNDCNSDRLSLCICLGTVIVS